MIRITTLIYFLILSMVSATVLAELTTERSVISSDGTQQINAIAKFQEPVTGDLYIATQVDKELWFFIEDGALSLEPVPFRADSTFSGDINVLDLSGEGIIPGRYPLFEVVTQPNTDPLDFTNWVGGLNGLSRINYIIGLPVEESLDHDEDGFPDDDSDHDGFSDNDSDHDGFRDDDLDHDGFSDNDSDHDGFPDDDLDHNGFSDNDSDHDGFRDDDLDHDGFSDNDLDHDGL
ncbi:MAG: hypothetical protein HOF98_11710 [Gammaproteobacteria bacterium]|nr:hypothetical protein [Gammaproteobacteria bacterium]